MPAAYKTDNCHSRSSRRHDAIKAIFYGDAEPRIYAKLLRCINVYIGCGFAQSYQL